MELWLLENLCKPAVKLIPEGVHPNSLTIVNHVVAWTTFVLAISSPFIDARLGISVLFFTGVDDGIGRTAEVANRHAGRARAFEQELKAEDLVAGTAKSNPTTIPNWARGRIGHRREG